MSKEQTPKEYRNNIHYWNEEIMGKEQTPTVEEYWNDNPRAFRVKPRMDMEMISLDSAIQFAEQYAQLREKKAVLEALERENICKHKYWNTGNPSGEMSVICRMFSGYIKMCHWTGFEWLDMWQDTLEGEVVEWMHIPYD